MENLPGDSKHEGKGVTIELGRLSKNEESDSFPKTGSQQSQNNPNNYNESKEKEEHDKLRSFENTTKRTMLNTRGNFIMRQELTSHTPECNAKCGIIFNFVLALCCLAVGVPSVLFSNNSVEYRVEYTKCYESWPDPAIPKCKVTIDIGRNIISPALIYYELGNFFLNHRRLVKSKIWEQLRGIEIKEKDINCEDAWTMGEMFGDNQIMYTNQWGHTFTSTDPANPCGLFPRSYFNDTYKLYNSASSQVFINETEISNKYLRENYYKRNEDYKTKQWIDVENEHFINWMNVETFNTFRKLWGRIDSDLPKGSYSFEIDDNYNISMYKGTKHIVITSSNPLGENNFLGWALVAVASFAFLMIIILWVLLLSNRDKEFDMTMLKWK